MTIDDIWTIAVAVHAAIVATGALALEIRRWVESGPRLSLSIMPEAATFNMPGAGNNTYLVATVSNRGNAPTTITHFALRDFGTLWGRLLSKAVWTVVVPRPSPPTAAPNIPATLQPGEVWSGMALHNEDFKKRIDAGWLYVLIYARHRTQPTITRVRPPTRPSTDTKKL